jgi:sigma-B regulation protein RsbU (phosphoserine phosphatase)
MRETCSLQVCLCADQASDDVRQVLETAGYSVRLALFESDNGEPGHSSLIVVDGTSKSPASLQFCHRLRLRLGEDFVPILYITADPHPATRLASLESGADSYLLRPFDPAELLAQAEALLRIKDRHDRLLEKTAEVHRINKRLQTAYQQIDQELELASRIQVSFLPQTLPEVPQARFVVQYRPSGRVGGDFYDVFRLDERHFGLYIADVMGHGVPASLLTIFVKKGIRAKEITGNEYRLVAPGDVLGRLNRDLIDQKLSDQPFITMVYALFNYVDGTFHFARSGHPYPLYLPHDGPPELWQVEGTLLGVFETRYTTHARRLRPGDKVLLYTDGLDSAAYHEQPQGVPSLLACAGDYRRLPLGELVEKVAAELIGGGPQKDDLTLLGLEIMQ